MNIDKHQNQQSIHLDKDIHSHTDYYPYKHVIKKCTKAMKIDFDNWVIGDSKWLLIDAYVKVINENLI